MSKFEGIVDNIVFRNDENGWTVASIRLDGSRGSIAAVGVMPFLSAGEPGKQAPVAPRLGDEQAEAHGKGRCGIKEACSALPCLASVVGARLAVQAGQEEETACAAAQGGLLASASGLLPRRSAWTTCGTAPQARGPR